MQVSIGELRGKPVLLGIHNDRPLLDGNPIEIVGLTVDDLARFQQEVDAIPKSADPGYAALINSCRASFIVNLLAKCASDECIDKLTLLLDKAHYEVQKYLGEDEETERS